MVISTLDEWKTNLAVSRTLRKEYEDDLKVKIREKLEEITSTAENKLILGTSWKEGNDKVKSLLLTPPKSGLDSVKTFNPENQPSIYNKIVTAKHQADVNKQKDAFDQKEDERREHYDRKVQSAQVGQKVEKFYPKSFKKPEIDTRDFFWSKVGEETHLLYDQCVKDAKAIVNNTEEAKLKRVKLSHSFGEDG